MPRESIDQALQKREQIRTRTNQAPTARPGFDAATYQQAKQQEVANAVAVGNEAPEQKGGFVQGAKNFLGGAIDGFASAGRTIQGMLPRAISTVPNFSDGSAGTKANEMTMGERWNGAVDEDAFSTKAGNFVGEAATFVTPGGAALKAPNLAFQGARSFGVQSLNEGEINSSSYAAGATDVIVPPVLSKGAELGGAILKGLAGGLSGAGGDAVDIALQRPGATFKAIGPNADEGVKEVAQKVREGVQGLYRSAGDEYAQLLKEADITVLPRQSIIDSVQATMSGADDAITFSKKGVDFGDTVLTDEEARQLSKLYSRINSWKDFTPAGVNRLATTISRFRRGSESTQNFDRIVDAVRRDVREVAGDVAPTIKEANIRFADKMDLIDEIDNVLRTSPKLGNREGIRKTAESLSRLFNGNKELSREVVEDLEKALGIDILGTVAGQQLSEIAPRSTARIGGVIDSAIQAVGNPVVRNALPLFGAINQEIVQRIANVPGVPESARATLVQTIAEIFETLEAGAQNER